MPSYIETAKRFGFNLPPVVKQIEALDSIWSGFCPACRHARPMLLNKGGHWECDGCQVQVSITPDIHVLAEKGIKDFERGETGPVSTVDKKREIPFGKVKRDLRR